MSNRFEEIAALRRRLAEIEKLMAAEQRPGAAEPEVDVDAVIRRVSAQGRGAASASRRAKEKNHD